MPEKTLKYNIGGILAGKKLIIEDGFLTYKSVYAQNFVVELGKIETVVVDTVGFGKGLLKIVGSGTTLASVKLPLPWATKAQRWILSNK
jgi:hypothetical protein